MLYFFLNRNSRFIRVVEYLAIAMFCWIFVKGDIFRQGTFFKAVFFLYMLGFAIVKFCHHFNWYAKFKMSDNERGIRVHFKKGMVASSYVIFFVNLLTLLLPSVAWPLFGVLFFTGELYLHFILLYLHFRDKGTLPPNYFSFIQNP